MGASSNATMDRETQPPQVNSGCFLSLDKKMASCMLHSSYPARKPHPAPKKPGAPSIPRNFCPQASSHSHSPESQLQEAMNVGPPGAGKGKWEWAACFPAGSDAPMAYRVPGTRAKCTSGMSLTLSSDLSPSLRKGTTVGWGLTKPLRPPACYPQGLPARAFSQTQPSTTSARLAHPSATAPGQC